MTVEAAKPTSPMNDGQKPTIRATVDAARARSVHGYGEDRVIRRGMTREVCQRRTTARTCIIRRDG